MDDQNSQQEGPRPRIFLFCRTADNSHGPRLLIKSLEDKYDEDQVFYDLQKMTGGDPVASRICDAIASADVVLALIGPKFVRKADAPGIDWVEFELNTAHEADKPVIPILDGATPLPKRLPEGLVWLGGLSHMKLRTQDHDTDISKVCAAIAKKTATVPPTAKATAESLRTTSTSSTTSPAVPTLKLVDLPETAVGAETNADVALDKPEAVPRGWWKTNYGWVALGIVVVVVGIYSWIQQHPKNEDSDKLQRIENPVVALDISTDGSEVTVAFSGDVPKTFDLSSRDFNERTSIGTDTSTLRYSPISHTFAIGRSDGVIRIFNTDRTTVELAGSPSAKVTALSFAPDGKLLFAGYQDGFVRVWDVDLHTEIIALSENSDAVTSLATSPDGNMLASGSRSGNVAIWNVGRPGSGERFLPGTDVAVTAVVFSPDNQRLVAGYTDGVLVAWTLKNNKKQRLNGGHDDAILALDSDGSTYFGSARADHQVRVWAWSHLSLQETLTGHTDRVTALRFVPDGSALYSGSSDKSVRIWERSLWTGDPTIPDSVPSSTNASSARQLGRTSAWRDNYDGQQGARSSLLGEHPSRDHR